MFFEQCIFLINVLILTLMSNSEQNGLSRKDHSCDEQWSVLVHTLACVLIVFGKCLAGEIERYEEKNLE
jgi:hypothetical protein